MTYQLIFNDQKTIREQGALPADTPKNLDTEFRSRCEISNGFEVASSARTYAMRSTASRPSVPPASLPATAIVQPMTSLINAFFGYTNLAITTKHSPNNSVASFAKSWAGWLPAPTCPAPPRRLNHDDFQQGPRRLTVVREAFRRSMGFHSQAVIRTTEGGRNVRVRCLHLLVSPPVSALSFNSRSSRAKNCRGLQKTPRTVPCLAR
jgi:hypothetical protein